MTLRLAPLRALVLFSAIALSLPQSSRAEDASKDSSFTPREPSTSPELFGQTIRASEWQTPEAELLGFHVPDGFQVDLVAAEPTITKPMNLAFDDRGRLWLTQSKQYPFPAKNGQVGEDSIMILEDKDQDGIFESSSMFADELNIPIGLLPYGDGAICFSIPNLLYLRDTNGDGVCDDRQVILGPFDTTRDTHGMINGLRLGQDGWVYACHGFNNQSRVAGKDGHAISMTSGNVFRFRPDGSRVEHFTKGQVNPFGMARDRFGYWYSADCHSKPISQLIRGGCYPSFSLPDDGLGFIPPMMEHLHGSTAICGLAHTMDSSFPIEFQDHFLSGNVMTCRINRNAIEYHGATAKAVERPDLLTSEDCWFRPVDLQFGPDGALYIADFYNKIIGHYEVPLDHPDRDRKSGRIWRIRWIGHGDTIARNPVTSPSSRVEANNSKPSVDSLLSNLKASDATRALQVVQELMQRCTADRELNLLSDSHRKQLRQLIDSTQIESPEQAILLQSIVELLGTVGGVDDARWILASSNKPHRESDPVLWYSHMIALRNLLTRMRNESESTYAQQLETLQHSLYEEHKSNFSLEIGSSQCLLKVLIALKDSQSIATAIGLVERQLAQGALNETQTKLVNQSIETISAVIEDNQMERLLDLMDKASSDPNVRADQLLAMAQRQAQQRGKVLEALAKRCWKAASELATAWTQQAETAASLQTFELMAWQSVGTRRDDRRNWQTEKRALAKEDHSSSEFFSSFTLGEDYTGVMLSPPFEAKDSLSFWIVGHNGPTGLQDRNKNYVSLVHLDPSGNVLQELLRVNPPRSDIASRVDWDLKPFAGKLVQIRVVDGDNDDSYAWIGFGDSSILGLNPTPLRSSFGKIASLLELAGWQSDAMTKPLREWIESKHLDWSHRYRIHRIRHRSEAPVATELVDFVSERLWTELIPNFCRELKLEDHWDQVSGDDLMQLGEKIARRCSSKEQERLVDRLSKQRAALSLMAELCERGAISRESLRILPKSWWESLSSEWSERYQALKPAEAPASDRLAIVEAKAGALENLAPDPTAGNKIFVERCALCHKLGDQGKVIGPQLEGIGSRGIARLCEDILWPDRNVDEAFRMSMLILEDGESLTGLITERTEDSLLLTDQTGKQRRILVSEIDQEKSSKLSLMPGNFEEVLSDQDLASLIGYLRASVKNSVKNP